jgi:hypothetical protein
MHKALLSLVAAGSLATGAHHLTTHARFGGHRSHGSTIHWTAGSASSHHRSGYHRVRR